ncbi:hypothetical protein [Streptomyces iconiensis]|uniref:Uncharacterized protein n=1 Tax=Streptomyces iconiensis TaxID=1384038 RepID=A0ABT7AA94_9ACTN|nr:hypothetical protein [Streptomyces iconiensis]MDJ1137919.1 hypothetical protein [Streptomyces iconiensis]
MATLTAAAEGEHTGAMIALIPTGEDAARLAIEGGEPADELHLTLYYLGDAVDWSEDQRAELAAGLRARVEAVELSAVAARVFGAAHWNGGGDEPCWVWSVGDEREGPAGATLGEVHSLATEALEDRHGPEIPAQHTPWAAHICAAYSADPALLAALESRLGPVTFDRVRLAFGGDHTDVPLTVGAVTAAGSLRRQPRPYELAARTDFTAMDAAWQEALDGALDAWQKIEAAQRTEITAAVTAAVTADDLDQLARLSLDTTPGADLLTARLTAYAEEAGRAQQAEAEAQGVTVPAWSLDDEALTAAAFRDRLRQVAATTARVLGVGLVQSAVRRAMRVWGSGAVADDVEAHLAGLSDAATRLELGGAMSAAQNAGRFAVLAVAPPATYMATEILDDNSCKPCNKVDGASYSTLAKAQAAYPAGGYTGCLGGARCRGTVVAVWDEDAAGTDGVAAGATMPQQQTKEADTVPYSIVQDHPDCAADMPFAVVEGDDEGGELKGCHASRSDAEKQIVGLKAEDGEEEKPDEDEPDDLSMTGETAPWEGVLAVEGVTTGDGREFAPEALTWADLPVPLRWNKEDSHGGEPRTLAVNVGRIDRIWRDEGRIMGSGVLNLAEPDGQRVHDLIKGDFIRGVSIDADSIGDADTEFVWPDEVNEGEAEGDGDGDGDLFEMLFAQPEKIVFHGGRIRAATLVDIPAFAEAYVALTDEAGAVVAGGTPVTADELRVLAAGEDAEPSRSIPALHASAELWRPPAAWFSDPGLSVPTGITIDESGRIYGHAAQWGSCHIGQEGQCVSPPREGEHPYYMTGEVLTDDGTRVAVGQITVGTGHAPLSYGAAPAAEHYDNTGAAVADVAVGNDRHGIWVAGAVRPGADPLRVYELQAAGQVSGDWRRIGGQLRLVGLLAVNVPGFPVPRMRARVASGAQQALVAAGRPSVAWGRSVEEEERHAVRVVMEMLRGRVHKGGE